MFINLQFILLYFIIHNDYSDFH